MRVTVFCLLVATGCEPEAPAPAATGPPTPAVSLTPTAAGTSDDIDPRTGLIIDEGFETVSGTCTPCHSGKLIAQNRGTRADWEEMMRWMQKHHNLWKLGETEREVILSYLARNYGIDERRHPPRRRALPAYLMPPTAAELAASNRRQK